MRQEMMRFWDANAMASAGGYANGLHFVPERQPHQHLISQFLQAKYYSRCPTNSVKALKAQIQVHLENGCQNVGD